MRILHTSDWHLGKRLFKLDRGPEHELFLEWLLKTLIEEKINLLLIAGDVFDTPTPPHQSLEHFYKGDGYVLPIDEEVKTWVLKELDDATKEVMQTLVDFQGVLSILVSNLLRLEELDQVEIEKIFAENEVNLADLFQHKNLYIPYQEKLEQFLKR